MGPVPLAKGIRRYRSLARISKMAKELERRSALDRAKPVLRITPNVLSSTAQKGSTVTGVPIYGPEPGMVTVFANTTDGQRRSGDRPQPGESGCPIQISDSDDTTLADSDGTSTPSPVSDSDEEAVITDEELTESDEDALMPTVVVQAQQLIATSLAHRDQHDCPHQPEFKTALLRMSKELSAQGAYQQVTARFNTESQASWEARGAALLGAYADYDAAMAARLQSPTQEDGKWKRFGTAYINVLALLQLDVRLLHDIWPNTCGGETHFRSIWRTKIRQWLRLAKQRTAELHDEQVRAVMLLPDGATMALRNSAIEDSQRHWCFMYEAMHSLCSPTVVMAAAEAALRVTAMHWGFAETTAMEAVMAKCEERLPLTFGNVRPGLGMVPSVVAPGATDALWKLIKKLRVASTGSSSHINETQ